MSDLEGAIADAFTRARARLDAQPFIDETWAELDAHARHVCSIVYQKAPPPPDEVAQVIGLDLELVSILAASWPRVSERVDAARPYIVGRLASLAVPPMVPLVDLLFTLDLLVAALVAIAEPSRTIAAAYAAR